MRILLLTCLALLWAYQSFGFMQIVGQHVAATGGGVTCSGDMSDGDNESFESGSGQTCTTDWDTTTYDTDSVIDEYSSDYANCGAHSLKITCDGDNTNEPDNRAYVLATVGNTPNDMVANVRFYIRLPTLDSGQYLRFFSVGDDDNELTVGQVYIQWYNNGGTYQLAIRSTSGTSTEHFELSPETWYRFELTVKDSSSNSSLLSVYNSSGVAQFSSTGDPDVQIDVASGDRSTMEYFVYRDFNSSGTEVIYYVDDVVIDITGGGEIGAQSCE